MLKVRHRYLKARPIKPKPTKTKPRLTTQKKLTYLFVAWCLIVQVYCMVMVWRTGDSNALAILTGTAVLEFVAVYKMYSDKSERQAKIHMEKNYIPNYDEVVQTTFKGNTETAFKENKESEEPQ